ncbi:hypothetical protein P0136_09390 [Lentisphaerota bacterium ZTH]|nr:hypothetical protein JYG24_13100 [Lentisphaerota bacterium]WET05577.1 hypothetical protein P0136_09390 [Lentisphaerota bacterium ZTH]
MNRSILIVICDFIVLSVLSLSFGVAPGSYSYSGTGTRVDDYTASLLISELKKQALRLESSRKKLVENQQKLGYLEGREKQLKKINAELIKTRSRLEFLHHKLKSRKGEIGQLSSEQLQRQIEKELYKRSKLKVKMDRLASELEFQKNKYADAVSELHSAQNTLTEARDEISRKDLKIKVNAEKFKQIDQQLSGTRSELQAARKRLTETSSQLAVRKHNLSQAAGQIRELGVLLRSARADAKDNLVDLSYAKGRLSATEKELAETRSSLNRSRKNTYVKDLELAEARKKIDNLQKMLHSAVKDLSAAKGNLLAVRKEASSATSELHAVRTEMVKMEGVTSNARSELENAKKQLADAEEKLRSDALDKYFKTALKVVFEIREKRFLFDYRNNETFFLPELRWKGKHYIAGGLQEMTGIFREITGHSKVAMLQYMISKPKAENKSVPAAGPLRALYADNRVCMLEVPSSGGEAMDILTFSKLKKRGLNNLTLFKDQAFGKDAVSLNGRCSLNLDKGDRYLYIRNTGRRASGQVKGEVGDFIVTKQGEFAGVVVAVRKFDFGRREVAKCFVFPDNFNPDDAYRIPIVRQAGELYFNAFARSVEKMVSRVKKIEQSRPWHFHY